MVNYLSMTTSQGQQSGISRRRVLTGAAAVGAAASTGAALAACGAGGATRSGSNSAPVTVPAARVPVGGAVIVGQVVVTQPTEGTFTALSAVCTHQACLVSRVQGDTVVCTCHGSVFSTEDGSVISGPAPSPLPTRTVTVSGEDLVIS